MRLVILVSGLENREYGRRDPSRWPRGTLYPPGKFRSKTQATEFSFSFSQPECRFNYIRKQIRTFLEETAR
jgi:hypothetical protein